MKKEAGSGNWDLDPGALEADAEEHLRGRGSLGGGSRGGARELGTEELQRRERVVHGGPGGGAAAATASLHFPCGSRKWQLRADRTKYF